MRGLSGMLAAGTGRQTSLLPELFLYHGSNLPVIRACVCCGLVGRLVSCQRFDSDLCELVHLFL